MALFLSDSAVCVATANRHEDFSRNIPRQITRVNFFEVYLEKQTNRDEVFQLQPRPRPVDDQSLASSA